MGIPLAQLRPVMYQATSANKRTLREQTFLAALRRKDRDDATLSERFHENSKFRADVAEAGPGSDDADEFLWEFVEANTTPDYPGHRLVSLPDTSPVSGSLGDALERRRSRGRYDDSTLTVEQLSTLLGRASGVTATEPVDTAHEPTLSVDYRAYPSPGALYPIEIYPLVLDCDGLDEGVYYYLPEEHALRTLRSGEDAFPARVADLLSLPETVLDATAANVTFVLTASFWRVIPKYGDRGYRYALQESGHLAQNVQLVAESLDLNSVPVGGFYDDDVNGLLDLDGVNEAAVYTVWVGTGPRRSR